MSYFSKLRRTLSVPLVCLIFGYSLACAKRRENMSAATTSEPSNVSLINTAGIITAREILPNLSTALNIEYNTAASSNLLIEYGNFASSLPKFGDHGKGFTGVMSRLITNFVSGSCTLAVSKDAGIPQLSDRVVIRFINVSEGLTTATNSNTDRWRAFTKHLAYRFWGVVPSADELSVVDSFADGIRREIQNNPGALTAAQQTQEAAMLICSLIGSAPRALFRTEN